MNDLKNKNEELRKIFADLKLNNKESYELLYKNYYSLVYGIVFSIIKNKESTEDIVQEVFVKIYNMSKDKFPEKSELSWLYTVAKNEALSFYRKKKQIVSIEEIYEVSEESNEIEELIDKHTYNKIISGLNDQEKEIVSLKILSKFTFKKIGQMLCLPTATVQWKYYKAVNSLKISLGNLAMFIVTFIMLIVRKQNVKDISSKSETKQEGSSDNYSEDIDTDSKAESSNENSQTSNNKTEISNDIYNQNFNRPTENSAETVSKAEETVDIIEPVLIGFCGMFLIISIIFAIFFKNNQQKRNKKTSK